MPLRRHHEGLLTIDHPLRAGGIELGTRTTLLATRGKAGERGWLLHAPGPLAPEDHAAIARLGEVRAIVAPNAFHHLFLGDAARAYPDARLLASPALRAGPPSRAPRLRVDAELGGAGEPLLDLLGDDVLALPVLGMPKLAEFVFFHAPSRTLVTTDLVFNVRRAEGLFTRLFMRVNGAYGRFGMTRVGRSLVRDRDALAESVARVVALDAERVIMAHGEIVERGGRAALRESFGWLLEGRAAA